jgi:hypothetical protein
MGELKGKLRRNKEDLGNRNLRHISSRNSEIKMSDCVKDSAG